METQSQRSLGAVPRQAPPVASLASSDDTWAAEFLETEQNVIDWSRDFLAEHTASLGGPDPVLVTPLSARPEDKWAEQYLEDVPSLLTESDAEAEQSLEESRQWTEAPPPHLDPQEFQDFIASVGRDSAVTGSAAAGSSLQQVLQFGDWKSAAILNYAEEDTWEAQRFLEQAASLSDEEDA